MTNATNKTAFATVNVARAAAVVALRGEAKAKTKTYGAWIKYAEALNAYLPRDIMTGNQLAHWFDVGAKDLPQITDKALLQVIQTERNIVTEAVKELHSNPRKLWADIRGYARKAAEAAGQVTPAEPAKPEGKAKGADDKKSAAEKTADKAKGLQGALKQVANWLTDMAKGDEAEIAPTADMEAQMDKIAELWAHYRANA